MALNASRPLLDILAPAERPAPASKGTDLQQIRRWNRLLVLNCVRTNEGCSRASVAKMTGLSRPAVTSIVDTLIQDGLLSERPSPPMRGQRGRVIPLHFNVRAGFVIGIDMGRNHLIVVISDLVGGIIKQESYDFSMSYGPARCLARVCEAAKTIVEDEAIAWDSVVGLGLGMPGPLDVTLCYPIAPPGMPDWDGVRLREQLQDELKVPIYLDNNANMGALGESRFGNARQVANLIYVKLDSGIGCGIIIDKHLFRGGNGSAGEIGHIALADDGKRCACGNVGCLETIASIEAITLASGKQLPFEAIVEAAHAGDAGCRQAFARAGDAIGTVLAAIINLFNPTMIILDGKTMMASDFILVPTQAALTAHSLSGPRAHAQMVGGSLTTQAVSLGAVATVLDSIFVGQATRG